MTGDALDHSVSVAYALCDHEYRHRYIGDVVWRSELNVAIQQQLSIHTFESSTISSLQRFLLPPSFLLFRLRRVIGRCSFDIY